jgi:hypothetical protein
VVCLCLFVYISGIMNEINFNLGGLQQWSVCVPIFPAVVCLCTYISGSGLFVSSICVFGSYSGCLCINENENNLN